MSVSRRGLLITGIAALPRGLFARSVDGGEPFTLELPELKLDPRLPTYAAVDTSGFTNCQVLVSDAEKKIRLQSKNWGTEPDAPNGALLAGRLFGETPMGCVVQVRMTPTREATPSVALVVKQGEPEALALLRQAAWRGVTGSAQEEIERSKKMARLARFEKDPATPPGGQFRVDLASDSSILLRIWAGEKATGAPIYKRQFFDRPQGINPIFWDLHTGGGGVAPAGRYLAVLLCTPTATGMKPTVLASYFAIASA